MTDTPVACDKHRGSFAAPGRVEVKMKLRRGMHDDQVGLPALRAWRAVAGALLVVGAAVGVAVAPAGATAARGGSVRTLPPQPRTKAEVAQKPVAASSGPVHLHAIADVVS